MVCVCLWVCVLFVGVNFGGCVADIFGVEVYTWGLKISLEEAFSCKISRKSYPFGLVRWIKCLVGETLPNSIGLVLADNKKKNPLITL